MQILDKKGELHTNTIVAIILILVVGIGLFVYFYVFRDIAIGVADTEACRISVLNRAKFTIARTELLDVELQCPTQNINVLDDRDSKVKMEVNYFVEDRNDVSRVIANEMIDCWHKFGSGKINFQEEWNIIDGESCFVCSHIIFGEKAKKNPAISGGIENFQNYLIENKVPGGNVTYYALLGGDENIQSPDLGQINLDTSKDLVVTYNLVNERIWESWTSGLGAAGVGAGGLLLVVSNPYLGAAVLIAGGIALVVDDQDSRAFVGVSPLDELRDCKILR